SRTAPLVLPLVLGLLVGGTACAGAKSAAPSEVPAPFDARAEFQSLCASCHGARGQGAVGPQLDRGAVVRRYPDVADEMAVLERRGARMPNFAAMGLTRGEIRAIVDYTRNDL